jgi:hypothetical protein
MNWFRFLRNLLQGNSRRLVVEDVVSVDRKRYEELVSMARILSALFAMGVDTWAGYEEAMEIVEQDLD